MARLVADKGGSISGTVAVVGKVGITTARRSSTNCRASKRSAPDSKISRIEDSPGTVLERIISTPGVAFSASSSGMVSSASVSTVDRPGASV